MRKATEMLRGVGAVLAGYLVIVAGTILTFEVLLGGISYLESSPLELAVATVGACLTGLLGGVTAAFLAARKPLLHAIGVLVPLAADTVFVLMSELSTDPLWFDLAGSLTLMLTTIAGGVLLARRAEGPGPRAAV